MMLAGCGDWGLAQGSHGANCSGSGANDTIGDPGDFNLYLQSGGEGGTVRDYSGDPNGLAETNTCGGIAAVTFVYHKASSSGDVSVTPQGVGTCGISFFNSSGCVTDNVVVHAGAGTPSDVRRNG
jgi:hypothetical protein